MKTMTKNMFLIAAALILLTAGVSCVHGLNRSHYYTKTSSTTVVHVNHADGHRSYGSDNQFAGHENQRYRKTYYDRQHDYSQRFHKDR